jgi:predicted acyltransferase
MVIKRVESIDVLRGICIVIMILGNAGVAQIRHSDWNGLTLADTIFPMFIFVVGLAIPLSAHLTLPRVLRRTVILFAIGLFLNGFPDYNIATLRIPSVLGRIAACYFFAAILFMYVKSKFRIVAITSAILIGYWVLLSAFPNVSFTVDNLLLPGHLYAGGTFDSEGLVSTIPALASAFIGLLVGMDLEQFRKANLVNNLGYGLALVGGGVLWNFVFPVNKQLWTSSFVLVTGGISVIVFVILFYIIEVRNFRLWSAYLRVVGINAIFTYVFSELLIAALPLWFGFTWGWSLGIESLIICSALAITLFSLKINIKV